jgi:hypothetical protein
LLRRIFDTHFPPPMTDRKRLSAATMNPIASQALVGRRRDRRQEFRRDKYDATTEWHPFGQRPVIGGVCITGLACCQPIDLTYHELSVDMPASIANTTLHLATRTVAASFSMTPRAIYAAFSMTVFTSVLHIAPPRCNFLHQSSSTPQTVPR